MGPVERERHAKLSQKADQCGVVLINLAVKLVHVGQAGVDEFPDDATSLVMKQRFQGVNIASEVVLEELRGRVEFAAPSARTRCVSIVFPSCWTRHTAVQSTSTRASNLHFTTDFTK